MINPLPQALPERFLLGSNENNAAPTREDAADGFVFAPRLTPGGFDEFVEKVVPMLQNRGVFRRDYASTTLRDHLSFAERRNAPPQVSTDHVHCAQR